MDNNFNTKQLIRDYIEKHTAYLKEEYELIENINKFSALMISEKFNVSRNLASQYLNEWYKDGILHKTLTRPVYFFSRKSPEEYAESIYENKIPEELNEEIKEDIFTNVIGHDGSLYNVITQCKAAIKYPPNGLPILLTGTSGAGKSYLANMVYNYAVDEEIIEAEKQFVIVNCSEFANNPELLTANLFGYKKGAFTGADSDNIGLIQAANGGVLFLDEVHNLNPSCQEKLFLFMDKGIYHLMGDNKNWKSSSARLIFATTKKPEEALVRTLLRRIPVIVNVPSLDERSIEEKEQLIFSFIQSEAKSVNKEVMITQSYFQTLMTYRFRTNVGELKNAIKISCANAFLDQGDKSDKLVLKKYYLPDNMVSYSSVFISSNQKMGDNKFIDLNYKVETKGIKKILSLFDKLLNQNDLYMNYKIDYQKFMEESQEILTEYYDYLMFENKDILASKIDIYQTAMEKIAENICERYRIQFKNNGLMPLTRYLIERGNYKTEIFNWEKSNQKKINELYFMLKSKNEYEAEIVEEFSENIQINLDMNLSEMNKIILLLNIKFFNPDINIQQIMGVILSHGYSTASSIADAVNKLLNAYIFEAIDMPLNVTVEEIGERLQSLIKRRHVSQDIILLVDMGSLEDIHKEISTISNLNIGIINNITTKMALDVGLNIQTNRPMFEILQKASTKNISTFKIIENRVKEKAILFVSETGTEAARNMSELFSKSFPRSINVKIIPYDYYKLIKKGRNDEVFCKYDVIFIAGTLNPNIDEVPYLAIEDIISGNNLEVIQKNFGGIFSLEEMQQLKNNILMNFSLQNVVGYLTILNADKVLALANEALNNLQKRINIQLKSKSIIGLNVHLSCLVERLVKKIPIQTYTNLDIFEKEQKVFIQICKDSFNTIEKHYGVELPLSEIAYIYDYFEEYLIK